MKKFKILLKLIVFLLIFVEGFVSCEKKNIDKNDLITTNLSINGNNTVEILTGEWDCIKFAYTVDGKTISDITPVSHGWIAMHNRNDSL